MLEALMKASRCALKVCWAANVLLECTPGAIRATKIEEVDDASMERMVLIGTKKQVRTVMHNTSLVPATSQLQQHRCEFL